MSAGSSASSSTSGLVELSPLRRERDDAVLRAPPYDGIEGGSDDVDPQHHPRPAAVRVVVDLARASAGVESR